MSRKKAEITCAEDQFRRSLRELEKKLEKNIEEAISEYSDRVEKTLDGLRKKMKSDL